MVRISHKEFKRKEFSQLFALIRFFVDHLDDIDWTLFCGFQRSNYIGSSPPTFRLTKLASFIATYSFILQAVTVA